MVRARAVPVALPGQGHRLAGASRDGAARPIARPACRHLHRHHQGLQTMTWRHWLDWFVRFYCLSEKQEATAATWVHDVYAPAGITPEEAKAAALDVAKAGGPTYFTAVLAAVPDAVRRARAA